jgi:hypothetical protein
MLPVVIFGALGGALLLDRGQCPSATYGRVVGPPTRTTGNSRVVRFGVAPAAAGIVIAPAAPILLAIGAIGVTAFVGYQIHKGWENGDIGAWLTSWLGASATFWAMSSAAWAATTGEIATRLRKAGLRIDPRCAWIFAPEMIFQRTLQLFREEAAKNAAGRTFLDLGTDEALDHYVENIAKRVMDKFKSSYASGNPMAKRLPGEMAVIEALFLVLGILIEVGDSHMVTAALAAIQRVIEEMQGCWNGLRRHWPAVILKSAAWFVGVLSKTLAKGVSLVSTTLPQRMVLMAAFGKLLDDVIEGELLVGDDGDKTLLGHAVDWFLVSIGGEPLPAEVREEIEVIQEPGPKDPKGEDPITQTCHVVAPDDYDVYLEQADIVGIRYEVGHEPTPIHWGSYRVYARRSGTGEAYAAGESPITLSYVGRDFTPTYRMSISDGTLTVSHDGETIATTVLSGTGTTDVFDSGTWATDQLAWLEGADDSRFEPGVVPPGTYHLMWREAKGRMGVVVGDVSVEPRCSYELRRKADGGLDWHQSDCR